MKLDDYKPVIDITKVSTEILELWYGKISVKVLNIIHGCNLKIHESYTNEIIFYINNDVIMYYNKRSKNLWLNYNFWAKYRESLGKVDMNTLFQSYFSFQIKEIKVY